MRFFDYTPEFQSLRGYIGEIPMRSLIYCVTSDSTDMIFKPSAFDYFMYCP